jgi:hypothetical protein
MLCRQVASDKTAALAQNSRGVSAPSIECEEGQNTLGVADLKRCEILIDQVYCGTLIEDAVLVVAVIADSPT